MPYSAKIKDGEWRQEWLDMPEFEQEDKSPYRTLFIHFENDDDIEAFGKLIGQKITEKKKYYWYPERKKPDSSQKRYIDEENYIDEEV